MDSHFISFRDFARWIAFDDYKQKNKHFRPQSYMCPPCKTRYSFVIKERSQLLNTQNIIAFLISLSEDSEDKLI